VKKALRKHSVRAAKKANKAKERGDQGAENVRTSGGPFSLPDDVDFGTVLNRAIMDLPRTPHPPRPVRAHAKPLLDYITTRPLLDPGDRANLAGLVRRLLRRIDELEPRKPGRPARRPDRGSAVEQAERNAAWLVRFTRAEWLRQHHRKRVPAAETDKMIREARREAARAFKVPESKVSEDNIRRALKSGRP
jgi:hypothetical protein